MSFQDSAPEGVAVGTTAKSQGLGLGCQATHAHKTHHTQRSPRFHTSVRTAVRFHNSVDSGAVPFFFSISRRDQRSLQSNRLISLLVTRPYSPSPPSSLLRWAPVIAPLWAPVIAPLWAPVIAPLSAPVIARVMGSRCSVRHSKRRSVRRDPSAGIASACSRKKLKPRTVRPSGSWRSQSSHSAPDEGGNQWGS